MKMAGHWQDWSWWLCLIATCALVSLGLVMVYSATADVMALRADNPEYYLNRHLFYGLLGLLFAFFVYRTPMQWWRRLAPYLLILGFIMLVLVLVAGVTVNGSRRWLGVRGLVTIQVSEVVKLCCLVYLADYIFRRQRELLKNNWAFIKPLVLMLVPVMLLLLQPDFGASVVLVCTTLALLFLSGARLWPLVAMSVLGVLVGAVLVRFEEYRWTRFLSFMDPWPRQFDSGFQLVQSLISYGRGDVTGAGLGQGVQKLFFLPEAHTDFIFAVIAEEFGLVGNLTVILMFVVFVGSLFSIAHRAEQSKQLFSAYLVYGIALLMAIQAIVNFGVSMGMLPTKGLTLPFVSFGGSSLVINMMLVSIALRSATESRPVKRASPLPRRVAGPLRRAAVGG